jgi:homoserine dehydrogenase
MNKLHFPSFGVGWQSLPLMQQVNLGIIGAGTVGGGVYQAIQKNGGLMACRFGVRLEIAKIATRDLKKPRSGKNPGETANDRLAKAWSMIRESILSSNSLVARQPHEKSRCAP